MTLQEWFNDIFWRAYPRRVAKKVAWKSLQRINPDEELRDRMISAVRRYAESTDPKYLAHPATWLNQERWEDEVVTKKSGCEGFHAWR